jgi:hypothetical protein
VQRLAESGRLRFGRQLAVSSRARDGGWSPSWRVPSGARQLEPKTSNPKDDTYEREWPTV